MTQLLTPSDVAAPEPGSEAPTTNPPKAPERARGGGFRKWRNRFAVLVMVAAAAVAAVSLSKSQAVARTKLHLDDVVLTAQPIEVQATQPGLVTDVNVRAGERVTTRERLGTIDVTTTDSKGDQVTTAKVLRAPSNGIVVDDPLPTGSTLQPGSAFVQIYDPVQLQLVTSVPLSYLARIRAGMTAELSTDGISGKVKATLQRAVPRVGSAAQSVPKDDLQLVFAPAHPAQVAKLIPGLRFSGSIDTSTGPHDTKSADYIGGS